MSIPVLEERIRDLINRPRTRAALAADDASWNTLCSALDVIGDTELALEAYRQWRPVSTDGERYLLVYGVLQVLLVQQDAVKSVCQSPQFSYSEPRELTDIRFIRNAAIGHPMRGRKDGILMSNFIRRLDLKQQSFTLMTTYSDSHNYEQMNINISNSLSTQSEFLIKQMERTVKELKRREMAHRILHRDEKLVELFPGWIHYLISKCYEAAPLRAVNMAQLRDVLDRFRETLKLRGEWHNDSDETYHINILEHALRRLSERPGDPGRLELTDKDVHIFLEFIDNKFNELKQVAEEIDKEYATEI